ncbi:MAG: DUF1641 domain-containing protein [Candidatus Nanopelagicales bacterium]
MSETTVTEPTVAELSSRIDRMAEQMDFITAELQAQRASRERWAELTETLVPVSRGALDMATRELEDLSPDVTADDAARFARTAARALPKLEVLLAQLDSLSELLHTVNSLSGAGVDRLTEILAVADDKGYFAFARQGGMIADRVVTEFTEDDVRALGENVVTILNAVKEMTQPEVMGLVQRVGVSVSDVEDTPMEPPSLFALLKSMRDPQTRRGLGKVMAMLHTVGEENPPAQTTQGRK